MQLKDQAAIVTGGASGLGAATARKLAAQGAKVAVCDLNLKLAESVAAELKGVAIACDVSDAASAEAAIAQAVTKRARKGPTETQVPLASLKSSAMRPSKSKPASRLFGSAGFSASPSL